MVTKTSLLKQMEELIEEPGLTCCICREGYKFQVHTFSGINSGSWIFLQRGTYGNVCFELTSRSLSVSS